MALQIKSLVYNAFQVNTYAIFDDSGACLLVDPACYSVKEQEHLSRFISDNNLTVTKVINTHSHIDHVLGNGFIFDRYGVKPMIHHGGLIFYHNIEGYASQFGFEIDQIITPDVFLEDGQTVNVGDEIVKIAYTPGHAEGSISVVHESGHWIVTGDLLFRMSIGRTDFPTGSIEQLLKSIHQKIFIYKDDFIIYPGHGDPTTVGFEKRNNPYL